MEVLTEERRAAIRSLLDQKDSISVKDLVDELNSSEATIRRDLKHLEDRGVLTRVHGGAINKPTYAVEAIIGDKLTQNTDAKKRIGQFASQIVQSGDTIFLDAGTTTREMITYLPTDILVVTNSLSLATLLDHRKIETIILGGRIKHQTDAIIGACALEQLRQYQFKHVFLGINGIDATFGLTTPDVEEAAIKKTAIQQGVNVYILADHTKFDQVTFAQIDQIDSGTIITDQKNNYAQFGAQMKVVN